MNLETNIVSYLKYCRNHKKLTPKTLKAYDTDLKQFIEYNSNITDSLCKSAFSNYIVYLHSRFKPRTVRRKLASLKAFFNYLEYEDILVPNPLNKCKLEFKSPMVLPKTLSLEQIKAILTSAYENLRLYQVCSCSYIYALRDVAVLELLFATGIRVSELCFLKIKSMDLSTGKIQIYGKGAKERIIYIQNEDVLSILKRYQNHAQKSSEFFFTNNHGRRLSEQSVRHIVNNHVRQANLNMHITPHMFRHTFATLLLEEDVDIRYIQQILGHSSITTTQIYTHVSSSKQRDIMLHKHPRNKLLLGE